MKRLLEISQGLIFGTSLDVSDVRSIGLDRDVTNVEDNRDNLEEVKLLFSTQTDYVQTVSKILPFL